MRPELEQQLAERYPKIFSKIAYLGCDDGWFNLIDVLCSSIQNHIDAREASIKRTIQYNEKNQLNSDYIARDIPDPISQVVADQIKEKFGELRFYYSGGDEEVAGMVTLACNLSERTCELCGKPGALRTNRSWIKTLCDEHAA